MSLHWTLVILIAIHAAAIVFIVLDAFRIILARNIMAETGANVRLYGVREITVGILASGMAGGAAAVILYLGFASAGADKVWLSGEGEKNFMYLVALTINASGLLAASVVFHIISGKLLAKSIAEIQE